jgi:hypothetical protein
MTLTQKRTIFDAVILEPVELIISQPHQALISSASVFLVAAEAGILIDSPFNVLLAVGAEWAYLKGLSSGQQVQTRWAPALNWSAVLLVVLYGSLWGLRKFGAIPVAPPLWGAILLTLIHILCIGAVTICSAMVHAAMLAEQKREHDRRQIEQEAQEQRRQQEEEERARRLQAERDVIELERQRMQAQIQIEWQRRKAELTLREAEQASRMQMQDARKNMRRNALPERVNAGDRVCPKCGASLDRPQWLAARRWGHCAACKEPAE